MRSIVVGTAGHIDHGKTALVRALTGIDADRLAEEKRRGITIDLGFAYLELNAPDGSAVHFSFVDVPGHERFVHNMLAGAGGIDLLLMVIAANESIKPQTREHFDICRLLGIPLGITALTKCDLADAETLSVVRSEVSELVRGSFLDSGVAPMIPVSALSGSGIEELRAALVHAAMRVPPPDSSSLFRLPIDRVFTMKGFGTVVTGTAVSGSVRRESEVEALPGGKRLRVRGIEVHSQPADTAGARQRVALNVPSAGKEELARGTVLVSPGALAATAKLDAKISLLRNAAPLKHRSRVHLHSFAAETIAEVLLLGESRAEDSVEAYVQFRLANAILTVPGDRFIIRQFSPVVTIGGGVVLDTFPWAKKQKPEERIRFLQLLEEGNPEKALQARIARRESAGLSMAATQRETGWTEAEIEKVAIKLCRAGQIWRAGTEFISTAAFSDLQEKLLGQLRSFHDKNRLAAGIGREMLRDRLSVSPAFFGAALDSMLQAKKIEVEGDTVRLAGLGVRMDPLETAARNTIEAAFARAGLAVPALKEVLAPLAMDRIRAQKIVTLLLRDRVLIRVSDELVFHANALNAMRATLNTYKAKSTKLDVLTFKDLTGVSRKYAIPLLEWLDRERVTRRVGDQRVIL